MRRLNWVHRDLKPGNLLLSRESLQEAAAAEGGLKIGDFGFARDLAPEGLAETWVRARPPPPRHPATPAGPCWG